MNIFHIPTILNWEISNFLFVSFKIIIGPRRQPGRVIKTHIDWNFFTDPAWEATEFRHSTGYVNKEHRSYSSKTMFIL